MKYNEYPEFRLESGPLGIAINLTVDSNLDELLGGLRAMRHRVEESHDLVGEVDRLIAALDDGRRFIIGLMGFDPWDENSEGWVAVGGWFMATKLHVLCRLLELRGDTDELEFMQRWFRIKPPVAPDQPAMIVHPMEYNSFLFRQLERVNSPTRLRMMKLCSSRPRVRRYVRPLTN